MLNGNEYGRSTTIDKAGRFVIPKAIRTAANLEHGTEVQFRVVYPGRLEIEPVPFSVALKRRGRLVVVVPERTQPVLKKSVVEDTTTMVCDDTRNS